MTKFNLRDKVRIKSDLVFEEVEVHLTKGSELSIRWYGVDEYKNICYRFEQWDDSIEINESDLELIEPNTIEEDTQEEMLKFHNDQSIGSSVGQAPVGLDYESEYNILLEEHEELKELLEIAKVALKLTTELISTNE